MDSFSKIPGQYSTAFDYIMQFCIMIKLVYYFNFYFNISGFIAPTIRERLNKGHSISDVVMLPALFLIFLQSWHRGKLPYFYQDSAMIPEV